MTAGRTCHCQVGTPCPFQAHTVATKRFCGSSRLLHSGKLRYLKVGLSGSYLQADLPIGKHNVYRSALDATLSSGGLSLWGEFLHQDGLTVTHFPIAGTPAIATTPAVPGASSAKNDYVLAGAQYSNDRITVRYNFSLGAYRDQSVNERLHVPAIQVNANENVSLLTEFVFWDRNTPAGKTWLDRSLNVTLYAHF